MTDTFLPGDVVDLALYETIRDHYGICEHVWNQFVTKNPHAISSVMRNGNGTVCYYQVEADTKGIQWCWPPEAFVLHQEVAVVEVDDLL